MFEVVILNLKDKTFIVYVISFTSFNIHNSNIHHFYKAQIISLKVNKTFTAIFSKYVNFVDIFSLDLIVKFSKYIKINDYTINLIDDK